MFASLIKSPFTSVADDFGLFEGLLELGVSIYMAPHMMSCK